MRTVGVLLFIIGGIWALFAFNMNTSVSIESQYVGGINIPAHAVHNIGLMDEKRSHLIISALLIVVGVILFVFGKVTDKEMIDRGEMKKCPHCAEVVKTDAKICRYCGKELPQPVPKFKNKQEYEKWKLAKMK